MYVLNEIRYIIFLNIVALYIILNIIINIEYSH